MKRSIIPGIIFLFSTLLTRADCLQVPYGEFPQTYSRIEANALSLIKAVKVQDLDGVKDALKNAAPVNCCDKSTQYTALMWAAHFGNTDIVYELVKAGADLNAASKDGDTALTLAANAGHNKVVQLLLNCDETAKKAKRASKANVDAQTSIGMTPLMFAAMNGHTDVVKTLLHQLADLTLIDRKGRDVYYYIKLNPNSQTAKAVFAAVKDHANTLLAYASH